MRKQKREEKKKVTWVGISWDDYNSLEFTTFLNQRKFLEMDFDLGVYPNYTKINLDVI